MSLGGFFLLELGDHFSAALTCEAVNDARGAGRGTALSNLITEVQLISSSIDSRRTLCPGTQSRDISFAVLFERAIIVLALVFGNAD